MKLSELKEKGLLKSHRYQFLTFKDNRNMGELIATYEDKFDVLNILKENQFNQFSVYQNYLPRVGILNLLNSHPELETMFLSTKTAINHLNKFELSPLISEEKDFEWFSYDDESINFLSTLERRPLSITTTIKYDKDKKIYCEDKLQNPKLKNDDLIGFFVKMTMVRKNPEMDVQDIITKKCKINASSTALELLEIVNKKVQLMKEDLAFEPTKKILKVRNLHDYILDIKIPLINFDYIDNCVRKNLECEYEIIDNPFLNEEGEEIEPVVVPNTEIDPNDKEKLEHSMQIGNSENEYTMRLLNIGISSKSLNDEGEIINKRNDLTTKLEENNNQESKGDELFEFISDLIVGLNDQTKTNIDEAEKIVADQSTSIMIDDETSIFGMSMMNQSSFMNTSIHPLARTSKICKIEDLGGSKMSKKKKQKYDVTFQKRRLKNRTRTTKPNLFTQGLKETSDVFGMLVLKNDPVKILDINRPFSIVVKDVNLREKGNYNSHPFEDTFYFSVLRFQFQIFCGLRPFTSMKELKWISYTVDKHPCFNKRIYFDINYNALPIFSSLVIKIKHNIYTSSKALLSSDIVGWVNFKLFDHNRRLMTGMHKLSFLETKFDDDSYFCYLDNMFDKEASNICFEIDSFSSPIINILTKPENVNKNPKGLMVSNTDEQKIKEIENKSPFDELSNYDKDIMWTNRFKICQEPKLLAKLLNCINYKDPAHCLELEKILEIAGTLNAVQSLELLTGHYLHESIRVFAVNCLKKCTQEEIKNYLIQLIQGLKYEMYHDNELARFLLGMAIAYPLTIGHKFFWSLRSEMHNPIIQQRFGIYLEIFLDKIGGGLKELFEDECNFVNDLLNLAQIPKNGVKIKNKKARGLVLGKFNKGLNDLNEKLSKSFRKEVSLPINFKYRIKGLRVNSCNYYVNKYKKVPINLVFENADNIGEDIRVLYKSDDDFRMDIVTLQLFHIMNNLWYQNNLKLKMTIYDVTSTGYHHGMMEILGSAFTLKDVKEDEGNLLRWMNINCDIPVNDYIYNFLFSNVAYCCAVFIIGISDRGKENIMIKKNGELFHIDFEQFLTMKNLLLPFVFTREFCNVFGGDKSQQYKEFKNKLLTSYKILRENASVLISLLRILMCIGIPDLNEESIKYLESSLCLNNNEEEAINFIEEKLNESLNSWTLN